MVDVCKTVVEVMVDTVPDTPKPEFSTALFHWSTACPNYLQLLGYPPFEDNQSRK